MGLAKLVKNINLDDASHAVKFYYSCEELRRKHHTIHTKAFFHNQPGARYRLSIYLGPNSYDFYQGDLFPVLTMLEKTPKCKQTKRILKVLEMKIQTYTLGRSFEN